MRPDELPKAALRRVIMMRNPRWEQDDFAFRAAELLFRSLRLLAIPSIPPYGSKFYNETKKKAIIDGYHHKSSGMMSSARFE
ncbi:hypothetical protein BCV73_34260 [Paenibacillus sp. SSG-1]|nr:hypothetical protein BCV73_34260 [Paenibacillus sp. SSG-1]